jgi:hypothetical protein
MTTIESLNKPLFINYIVRKAEHGVLNYSGDLNLDGVDNEFISLPSMCKLAKDTPRINGLRPSLEILRLLKMETGVGRLCHPHTVIRDEPRYAYILFSNLVKQIDRKRGLNFKTISWLLCVKSCLDPESWVSPFAISTQGKIPMGEHTELSFFSKILKNAPLESLCPLYGSIEDEDDLVIPIPATEWAPEFFSSTLDKADAWKKFLAMASIPLQDEDFLSYEDLYHYIFHDIVVKSEMTEDIQNKMDFVDQMLQEAEGLSYEDLVPEVPRAPGEYSSSESASSIEDSPEAESYYDQLRREALGTSSEEYSSDSSKDDPGDTDSS